MIEYSLLVQIINTLSDGKTHLSKDLCRDLKLSQASLTGYIQLLRNWNLNISLSTNQSYRLQQPIIPLDKNRTFVLFINAGISLETYLHMSSLQ